MMSPPLSSNRIWERADELVLKWERMTRVDCELPSFAESLLRDLNELCDSSSCLHCVENGTQRLIANDGYAQAHATPPDRPATHWSDLSPAASWSLHSDAIPTLYVSQSLHREIALTLTLELNPHHDIIDDEAARRKLMGDVAKAALEIVSVVYLRHRLAIALLNTRTRGAESQKIAALYGGTNLRESFQAIAKAWENHVAADRVSILQLKSHRSSLISTAAGSPVDLRSRHAVLLQALSDEAVRNDEEFLFMVGEANSLNLISQPALDRYLIESNCRRLNLQLIRNPAETRSAVAVIVTEWFTGNRIESDPLFQDHIKQATLTAIDRDTQLGSQLLTRFGDRRLRTKVGIAGGIMTFAVLLLIFVPTEFSIPADGKIIPAVRHRLFAPANATVTGVAVRTGQVVKKGDSMLVMRSTAIELREEQQRGDLLNARTQLSSLAASRMGTRRGESDKTTNTLSISANEELLKTQITGLEKQLVLVEIQRRELMISSPIDGIVSRWDLDQSLAMRPVTQGQFLLDVYSPREGWIVELDVPDKDISYLLDHQESLRRATCRLQSQPDRVLQARVIEIAGSAQVNPQGRSMIRVKCSLDDDTFIPDAIGTTVWADVDCGRRSIGFVWFRGVIEWWDRQSWY